MLAIQVCKVYTAGLRNRAIWVSSPDHEDTPISPMNFAIKIVGREVALWSGPVVRAVMPSRSAANAERKTSKCISNIT